MHSIGRCRGVEDVIMAEDFTFAAASAMADDVTGLGFSTRDAVDALTSPIRLRGITSKGWSRVDLGLAGGASVANRVAKSPIRAAARHQLQRDWKQPTR